MQKVYFAAVNSADGFVSYYDRVFSEKDRMYIIKGGPGTGKSTLMRKIVSEAEKRGLDTELILCSSDPDSLDGVIIPALDTAIADGTAPHLMDASLPGARDELINLGDYWNSNELYAKREELELLNHRKSAAYTTAFSYLSAIGKIENDRLINFFDVIDRKKISTYAHRLVDIASKNFRQERKKQKIKISREIKNETVVRAIGSIGMNGYVYLPTFEMCSNIRYHIIDRFGIGFVFLDELAGLIAERGLKVVVGVDAPFNRTCGIFLPELGISFTVTRKESSEEEQSREKRAENHTINMNRFFKGDLLSELKPMLRRADKYKNLLGEEVKTAFTQVRDNHFKIEKIYKDSMDFQNENELTKHIISKLFS